MIRVVSVIVVKMEVIVQWDSNVLRVQYVDRSIGFGTFSVMVLRGIIHGFVRICGPRSLGSWILSPMKSVHIMCNDLIMTKMED